MEKKVRKKKKNKERIKYNPLLKNKTQFINPTNYSQKIILFLKLIIPFQMFINIISKENQLRQFESRYSYITLNINQEGNQNFLSSEFNKCPDEVYINGNKTSEEICKNIVLNETNNQIKLVWQNEINSTDYMFYKLYNIKKIDLSHFNSSLIKNMSNMFSYCYNLSSIDFANINTTLVTSMDYMFRECLSLTSINLKNFKTNNVISMESMFDSCILLNNLDLSSFNTSQVNNMNGMFSGCSQLTSFILTNFDTSSVTNMNSMFKECSSLVELDLSSFNLSSILYANYMFKDCTNLKYINLNNSIENINFIRAISMFNSVPINIAICIDVNNNKKIDISISKLKCPIIDCSNDWKKHQKKIILGNSDICFNNCYETENNKYEYDNICYEEYSNITYLATDYINEQINSSLENNSIIQSEKFENISYEDNLNGTHFNNYTYEIANLSLESNSINYKEYLNGTQFKNYTYEVVNLIFHSNYIFQSEEFEINKYLKIEIKVY